MQLENLRVLHLDMIQKSITQQKFTYQVDQRATFEVLFSVRSKPFSLAMTARAKNLFLLFDILPGYRISLPLPNKDYSALANALRLDGESFQPFKPHAFFSEFNAAIPATASPNNTPSPADIVRIRPDLPEQEKPYFLTWRRNDIQGHQVSEGNLIKTRELLGNDAADYSVRENLSSCWTSREKDVDWETCLPI